MKMVKLGRKPMYDSPSSEIKQAKEVYPYLLLPMKVLGDMKCTMGDICELTLKVKVTGLQQDQYAETVNFDVMQGSCESAEEEKSEGKEKDE